VRSILYRFPDPGGLEALIQHAAEEADLELALPADELVEDGEWVLAVFELGRLGRATSAAARATVSPEGARLLFEPRDFRRLMAFAKNQAHRASSRPPEPGAAPLPAAGSRVLLVDDDPDIRELVTAMLEAVELVVTAVASAEDALEKVAHEGFDLLVLDWNLPRMTGVELCRRLRNEQQLGSLPVLFLTANASSQDMVEALAAGGDDYVVKPFRAPELGARIFSLLRRSRRPSLI